LECVPKPAELYEGGHIAESDFAMKSRFQPDANCDPVWDPTLIDPEAFDVSEQRFAASLEEKPSSPPPRFVVEYAEPPAPLPVADEASSPAAHETTAGDATRPGDEGVAMGPGSPCQPAEPDSWRREVAARVNDYRGRRPRTPRYPSLQLRFEAAEPLPKEQAAPQAEVVSLGQLAITMDPEPTAEEPPATPPLDHLITAAPPDSAAKVLAFPRSSFMPVVVVEELAEPVFKRPRILEVPEVLPPPPALGGILIESPEESRDDRRPGFELPLKPAPLSRRVVAGATDALVVAAAFVAFAYIFFRITAIVPPLRQGMGIAAILLGAFWAAYQYLLLVYAGSTPGLKLAGLQLSRFDGRAAPRKLRRWRVLASVLSGLSLALGYVWCFMDEDELCWHDRITHTYMAPKAGKPTPAAAPHS
jgi:uncharacterized RDD family membrane protein YckC